ncbi:MAG: hypothetical protein U9Q19_12670 [Pseudomonadota bacterium]|nr:hypothetical protein [Pseudomonadota bacterium]
MNPEETVGQARRNFLKTAGKFAVYTPPAVMMLMKPAYARMNKSMTGRPHHRHHGNNGIGNGMDGQPWGNPKPNDTRGVHKGRRPYVEDR